MGFSFLKKSSTEAVKKMNGQAAADACIAPHNSTATVPTDGGLVGEAEDGL